jgi:hypothetical protein
MTRRALGDVFRQTPTDYAAKKRAADARAAERLRQSFRRAQRDRVSTALAAHEAAIRTGLNAAIAAAAKGAPVAPLKLDPIDMGSSHVLTTEELHRLPAYRRLDAWCRAENVFFKAEVAHESGSGWDSTGYSRVHVTADFGKPYVPKPKPVKPVNRR